VGGSRGASTHQLAPKKGLHKPLVTDLACIRNRGMREDQKGKEKGRLHLCDHAREKNKNVIRQEREKRGKATAHLKQDLHPGNGIPSW